MGFFSKLFGQKLGDGSKPDLAFYEKVVDSIVVSGNLKADVKRKLKAAFENPRSFYDGNDEFILSERGLTYPEDALSTPKFVLIDTLQNKGEMSEVDWKEAEEEIRFSVIQILKAKEYNLVLSKDNLYDDNLDTFKIIELINTKELIPSGYALEILDIDSDCYVFTIVPLDKQEEVKALFKKLE